MTRNRRDPGLTFQPRAHQAMRNGIKQIADAVRPTLGPISRTVLIGREVAGQPPMLLDSGGLIARRIIELPDHNEDMGAMLMREMLWHVHQEVGDGTATAAILFEAIYNGGIRYLAAGRNAMRLRHYLESAVSTILNLLNGMSIPVEGRYRLEQLARSTCHDPALAKLLGEIFDILGQYGHLEIRTHHGRGLEREYIEGMYWEGGLLSRSFITDPSTHNATAENAAVLISDLPVETVDHVIPALELALAAGAPSLVIVTPQISVQALALLLANSKSCNFQTFAVKTPGVRADVQAAALTDLAVLTGGRPILKESGADLTGVQVADLGHARRIWANQFFFGVVGGKGSPLALRQHIATLREAFSRTKDAELRESLQQRLGKLMGGAATLWIGGLSDTEVKLRKEAAEQTARVLRGAASEGVLPGGGTALLACSSALGRLASQSVDPEECAASHILDDALQAPFRTLVANAGYDAGEVLSLLDRSRPGFDVIAGKPVDMINAGILDSASVVKAAVRRAVSSAALALTIDVLVRHRNPELVTEP